MKIYAVNQNFNTAFGKNAEVQKKQASSANTRKPVYDKNPIKKSGEIANALLATVVAGLVFGVRALAAIADAGEGDGVQFLGEFANTVSKKIIKRNAKPGQKISLATKIGGFLAVLAGFVAVLAAVYAIYNSPKAVYNAKVNTFKKGKEMDVYIRGNAVEQELYNQMNEKAKTADAKEKAKLNEQYMVLKTSKNIVPDFVKLNQKQLEKSA